MPNKARIIFGLTSAVLAFLFCLIAGIYFLAQSSGSDDTMGIGFGMYFIGKAFFVGPMLVLSVTGRNNAP